MGACSTHGIVVQPPDAVVGQHRPIALDCGQRRLGFGDHCTHKPSSVLHARKNEAEDNPVRRAMGMASQPLAHHLLPVTEVSSGLIPEAEVHA